MAISEANIIRQLSSVQGSVNRLESGVQHVNLQVSQVHQRADETHSNLQDLAREVAEFKQRFLRIAVMQRSETRIGVVEAQLQHRFGHHNEVRNAATGLLQAFDLGLISQDTVRQVSERLMVVNPRFWLAPVLVALGAWAENDRGLCERAVQEGFRRDPQKTSLFMALVLRRQARREASVRWLRHYFAALDPNALGRDFAMILECVANGAFGPAGVELVQERLETWRVQLLDDDAEQDAQVARWRAEVDGHIGNSSTGLYPRLAAVSPQWPQMDRVLSCARAHASLIIKYQNLAAEETTPPDRLEDQIDDILDRLVSDFDVEELPLRREHAEHVAVIKHNGDLNAVQADLATSLTSLESTLSYLTLQTTSALDPDSIGVSRSTQKMAVSSCHEWFGRAHAAFSRDYRLGLPGDVQAVFEGNHNGPGIAFDLPRWTGSFTAPIDHLERDLAGHWDRHAKPFIDSLAYDWRKNVVVPGIVVSAIFLLFAVCGGATDSAGLALFGFFVAAIAGGIWALLIKQKVQAAEKLQQAARDLVEHGKHNSITQLRAAGAELQDWSSAFRDADGKEAAVRTVIADLSTMGSAPAVYEQRVVGGIR